MQQQGVGHCLCSQAISRSTTNLALFPSAYEVARYNQVVFFFLLFYGNFWLSSCKSRARKTSVISIHQIFPFQCSIRKWTDRRKPVTTIWSEFLPSVELDIQAKFPKDPMTINTFFFFKKTYFMKIVPVYKVL